MFSFVALHLNLKSQQKGAALLTVIQMNHESQNLMQTFPRFEDVVLQPTQVQDSPE